MIRKKEITNDNTLALRNKGNACVYYGMVHRKYEEGLWMECFFSNYFLYDDTAFVIDVIKEILYLKRFILNEYKNRCKSDWENRRTQTNVIYNWSGWHDLTLEYFSILFLILF